MHGPLAAWYTSRGRMRMTLAYTWSWSCAGGRCRCWPLAESCCCCCCHHFCCLCVCCCCCCCCCCRRRHRRCCHSAAADFEMPASLEHTCVGVLPGLQRRGAGSRARAAPLHREDGARPSPAYLPGCSLPACLPARLFWLLWPCSSLIASLLPIPQRLPLLLLPVPLLGDSRGPVG